MTHVLITYPGVIPSVLLCGKFQLEELARTGKIELRSITRYDLTEDDCGWADTIFLIRSDSILEVDLALKWKRAGKKVIYVLDDDLLNIPKTSFSAKHFSQSYVKKSILTLIEICDVFVSPSQMLQQKYGSGKSATIQEPSSNHPDKVFSPDGPVKIGFAGSVDRSDDLDSLLGNVIASLLDSYGERITVEFLGIQPKIAAERHLKCIPYCDNYDTYQKTIEQLDWDIGLAPMPETPFHACKHYNKYIEYAGLGIAGVYSDVVPYTKVVKDGQNGFLCPNTEKSWIEALSRLIDDESLRRKISQNSQRQARNEFSVKATAIALEKSLGEVLSFVSPGHSPIRSSSLVRVKMRLYQILFAFRQYGFRAPLVAFKKSKQKKEKKKV